MIAALFRGGVAKAYRGTNKRIARYYLERVRRTQSRGLELDYLGSKDNGRTIPRNIVDANSICYSFGVGLDVSFDLELIARYGCHVHCFDPTPKSIAFIEPILAKEPKLHFHPIGIWIEDTELTFFNPDENASGNFSVYDLHGRGFGFRAKCRTIETIMRELGHQHIDLLKIDIEGGWFPVMMYMLRRNIVPRRALCLECDSPNSVLKSRQLVNSLSRLGFYLQHRRKDDLLFVRS
jgi:FkbM family methyltransferase